MSSILLCYTCATVIFSFVFVDCGLFPVQSTTFNQSESALRRAEILAQRDQNHSHALYLGDLINFNYSNNDVLSINKTNMSSNSTLSGVFNNAPQDIFGKATTVSKNSSEFALEGGGIVLTQNSSEANKDGLIALDGEPHSKKSKGRKGVKFPGSSVVPRKGAPVTNGQLIELQTNSTPNPESQSVTKPLQPMESKPHLISVVKNETVSPLISDQIQVKLTSVSNSSHSKKPEYVSDEKDFLGFDKYTIIKTSTTGEDYVIIGIVVVIGIWLSVFGALIFYRRAGEYWDRRHYRRMDFLVEGMYNE